MCCFLDRVPIREHHQGRTMATPGQIAETLLKPLATGTSKYEFAPSYENGCYLALELFNMRALSAARVSHRRRAFSNGTFAPEFCTKKALEKLNADFWCKNQVDRVKTRTPSCLIQFSWNFRRF